MARFIETDKLGRNGIQIISLLGPPCSGRATKGRILAKLLEEEGICYATVFEENPYQDDDSGLISALDRRMRQAFERGLRCCFIKGIPFTRDQASAFRAMKRVNFHIISFKMDAKEGEYRAKARFDRMKIRGTVPDHYHPHNVGMRTARFDNELAAVMKALNGSGRKPVTAIDATRPIKSQVLEILASIDLDLRRDDFEKIARRLESPHHPATRMIDEVEKHPVLHGFPVSPAAG